MDWASIALGVGKLFGAIGIVVSFGIAFLLYDRRSLLAKYQALLDAQPEAIKTMITALNQSTAAMDSSTRAKEANTAAVFQLKEASERHTASCERLAEEVRRIGESRHQERGRR